MVSLIGSTQNQSQTGDVGGARILGEKIAETINTVYINGNGYSIVLDLTTLNQSLSTTSTPFNFTATIKNTTSGSFVTVSTIGTNVDVKLIPKNINSPILYNNKIYNVTNVNGTVLIT